MNLKPDPGFGYRFKAEFFQWLRLFGSVCLLLGFGLLIGQAVIREQWVLVCLLCLALFFGGVVCGAWKRRSW